MLLFGRSDARLNRGIFNRIHLTRLQRGLVFGALTLFALLPLLYLASTPIASETDWTDGKAKLYFTASNTRVIFPNQCLDVTWNVEGIKTVHINEQGRVGTGTAKICDTSSQPTMQVKLLDGSTQELQIPVQKLYQNPLFALLLITSVVMLTLSVYNFIGTPPALAVLVVALTLPALLYYTQSAGLKLNAVDYSSHINIIQGIINGTRTVPPHFLYHVLSIGFINLFPQATLNDATLAILLIANILTCIAIYAIVRLITGKRPDSNWKWTLIYLGLPLVLFIGPINFKYPFIIISSYVYPNPPHSPTFIFLKPFALGLFACLIALLQSVPRRWWLVGVMAALTILATLAKPSYTLPLFPVLGLVFVGSFVRPLPVKRLELVAGVLLPAVVVLGWQYLFTYGPQQSTLYAGNQASIQFSPLELFLVHWHVPAANLVPEFIISLLFPIVVYVVYRRAWRDTSFNIAWLTFIAGQALAYLFIESPRLDNGNMVWSGRITSLVLFVVSIAFFLRQNRDLLDKNKVFPRDIRFYLGIFLLGLHIIPNLKLLF